MKENKICWVYCILICVFNFLTIDSFSQVELLQDVQNKIDSIHTHASVGTHGDGIIFAEDTNVIIGGRAVTEHSVNDLTYFLHVVESYEGDSAYIQQWYFHNNELIAFAENKFIKKSRIYTIWLYFNNSAFIGLYTEGCITPDYLNQRKIIIERCIKSEEVRHNYIFEGRCNSIGYKHDK